LEPVGPEEHYTAVLLLESQGWLPISQAEAERLTHTNPDMGKVPYLLRGLCVRCGKGLSFSSCG
ncbi:MAG: hypothetical protein ACREA0_21625, partial [bacterium]